MGVVTSPAGKFPPTPCIRTDVVLLSSVHTHMGFEMFEETRTSFGKWYTLSALSGVVVWRMAHPQELVQRGCGGRIPPGGGGPPASN